MSENQFKGTVEALFHGMDGVISSKTVVGEAIHIGDTIMYLLRWARERSTGIRKRKAPEVLAVRLLRARCL